MATIYLKVVREDTDGCTDIVRNFEFEADTIAAAVILARARLRQLAQARGFDLKDFQIIDVAIYREGG